MGVCIDGDALADERPEGSGFQWSGGGCTLSIASFPWEAHAYPVTLYCSPLFQVTAEPTAPESVRKPSVKMGSPSGWGSSAVRLAVSLSSMTMAARSGIASAGSFA